MIKFFRVRHKRAAGPASAAAQFFSAATFDRGEASSCRDKAAARPSPGGQPDVRRITIATPILVSGVTSLTVGSNEEVLTSVQPVVSWTSTSIAGCSTLGPSHEVFIPRYVGRTSRSAPGPYLTIQMTAVILRCLIGVNMGDVIRFIPKSERERNRLIREARAIYESIFPSTDPASERDKALEFGALRGGGDGALRP
jgi:hypothetical protein